MNPTPESTPGSATDWTLWGTALRGLGAEIRRGVREALEPVARGSASTDSVSKVVGQGEGDITFAIDEVAEEVVTGWLLTQAAQGPLSLLTEDRGWRHFGPSESGLDKVQELPSFDHGGPRIALDPIDGTRNIMHDLRSAWVVVSAAGAGPDVPRMGDLEYGLISEIPVTRAATARELSAVRGSGAELRTVGLGDTGAAPAVPRPVRVDDDGRIDRGYFPFISFHPAFRAQIAALGHEVMAAVHDGANESANGPAPNLATVFNDQYISSGGQLALLALGQYRSVVDARHAVGVQSGAEAQSAKPYDLAGAVLVAQEAGCTVLAPDGSELDFPMDVMTPVDFAGFHNAETAAAILPKLVSALHRRR